MDDSRPLWVQIEECIELLDLALAESKERGNQMVLAEAAYYSAKAEAVYRLKEEKMPATLVQMVVKGDPQVCAAMSEYHAAQVMYENAREARNVYKKKLDTLREEYEREWSRAGAAY